MAPRKAYSFKFKLDVVAYAKANTVSAASEKYGIARKCIRRWKSHEDKMKSVPEGAISKKMRMKRLLTRKTLMMSERYCCYCTVLD